VVSRHGRATTFHREWRPAYPAFAQLDSGTIVGYVRDQSGGSVQSATILITSEATNAQWTVKSDEHGDYVSPPLRAGMYSVRVEAAGFKVPETA